MNKRHPMHWAVTQDELDRLRAENAELRHRLIHTLTCELEEHEIAEYRNYLDKTTNETEGK
jgi:hypothetical protein